MEDVSAYSPLDFFLYYVRQSAMKHCGAKHGLHPFVRDHAFPPVDLDQELNLRFVRRFLMGRLGRKNKTLQFVLQGVFWAPDQPFCFREVLPPLLQGLSALRLDGYRLLKAGACSKHFDVVQRVIERRYVRGIDPALLRSGKRKGNVFGMGDRGLYNAEHQTSVMPGRTHPQGLRWKLEHWPLWLEEGVFKQIQRWPAADDCAAIETLLKTRYGRVLPRGVSTEIATGRRHQSILSLFGNDLAFALSALSQALLFRDILKPQDSDLRRLRTLHGLGAGTFTVRGYWMAYNRDRTLPALDTRTFCPGFTGAMIGAETVKLEEATGISVDLGKTISWDRWETQIRFSAWLYALQQHVETTAKQDGSLRDLLKRAVFQTPLHFTELEATLCFMGRLATMFQEPQGSMKWLNAAKAIGNNMPKAKMVELFQPL